MTDFKSRKLLILADNSFPFTIDYFEIQVEELNIYFLAIYDECHDILKM